MKYILFSLIGLLGLFLSADARADIHPGFRAGAYFDASAAFVGGEIELPFGYDWSIVPNAEYVFIDNGSEATFNFDFQYTFHTHYPVNMWAGAGPAIIYFNPENPHLGSETDFGVNLFFGIGFPLRDARVMPYIQPKIILSDNSEFALAFGLRF
jgi:hypothetical protein